MNNLDQEYKLFKSICRTGRIDIAQCESFLIDSLKNKGLCLLEDASCYTLNDQIACLSEKTIRSALPAKINNQIEQLSVIYETNSTNQAIGSLAINDCYNVVISEYQSNGQGRREKKWISPLASNIYLSIQFQLYKSTNIHFIPLISALSVCNALSKIGIPGCQIKWPNDIYLNNRKLGGILVESRYNSKKAQLIVVGIGLNVNMEVNSEIDQQWTSIRNNKNKIYDRNLIVSVLLSDIVGHYNQLSHFDLLKFKSEWSSRDYLKGKHIQVVEEKDSYPAKAIGIANDGALVIEYSVDNQMKQKSIYSAEVSVKAIANNIINKGS